MIVTIDSDDAIDMLIERVEFWTDDDDIVALFTKYYERAVYGGCFDGGEFNVKSIVDNDYVNNTEYGTREDIKNSFSDSFTEENVLAEHNGYILYYAC